MPKLVTIEWIDPHSGEIYTCAEFVDDDLDNDAYYEEHDEDY
jgi:hypothetical protein